MTRFTSPSAKLLLLLVASATAAACRAAPDHQVVATTRTSANQEVHPMKIRLIINDQRLSATLEDSLPAREFIAQLPLTLQLEDYAETEKIAQLPRRLNVTGEPEGITPLAGDIAFYAPWGNLAIFHRPFAYSKGLVRLGRVEGGLQHLRKKGPVEIRIQSD
ncbi:cyclophilin [Stenotrophomonas sp. MA5]|nr:cyclophilin [Stenotrophomonas sp. MA5]